MSKQAVEEYAAKYKPEIDRLVTAELEKRLTEVRGISPHLVPVVEAMRELSSGGKRVRGLLTILGYEFGGGKVGAEVLKAAAAMEIFHLGLLIHDDFMDRDNLRRGVETIHVRYQDKHYGETMAVLAGDYAYSWVTEILAELDLPAEPKLAAWKVWGKYFTRVGYGQTLDVMTEHLGEASEEELLAVAAIKSGEYSCVLPLQLGAALAGADREIMVSLKQYGMELGYVFQLRDDWLSEWGEESKTGKPVGNDRREGKKNFATLYGKERLEEEIQKHVEKGKESLQGPTLKGEMEGLLDWMATRES